MSSIAHAPDASSTEAITWQRRGLILVAAPAECEPELPLKIRRVHDLIACPTCHARVDETCRTRSGHTTTPHKSRLAPRLCPCGELVQPQRRYCDPCRDRIDRENRYAGVVRFRSQARKAS